MRNSKGISPWKFGRELSANHARVIFGSANNELPGNNPTNGRIRARGRAPANRARIHGEFIFSRRALRSVGDFAKRYHGQLLENGRTFPPAIVA